MALSAGRDNHPNAASAFDASSQGKRRIGDFELVSKLGQGAMGAVYLAHQVSLDRMIALKILPPELATDQEFLERFRREARAAAKLDHPHIVMAYDVGVAGGYHYIAMEYVDGKDLEQGLQQQPLGRYEPSDVLTIARHMTLALGAASAAGIVHRDMKPANILKHSDGTYKLTDLGLALKQRDDQRVSSAGSAIGTPFYISPEQARGEQFVDVRADIYSLGATLYHLSTGKLPFPGDNTVVVMTRHLTEAVTPPDQVEPTVPKALSRLILKMMAKQPQDRHQSARELFEDLERVARGEVPLLKRARAKARSAPELAVSESYPPTRLAPEGGRSRHPHAGGSLHPRLSRGHAGRRVLKSTGPLAKIHKLPKNVQTVLFWSGFLLLAIVVGMLVSRWLGPTPPASPSSPPPATSYP